MWKKTGKKDRRYFFPGRDGALFSNQAFNAKRARGKPARRSLTHVSEMAYFTTIKFKSGCLKVTGIGREHGEFINHTTCGVFIPSDIKRDFSSGSPKQPP